VNAAIRHGAVIASGRAERIAALGAGRMGRGIAIAFAYAGHKVRLVDVKPRPTDATEALRAQALDDERYASPAIIDRHMREGRNGLRDGRGFYDFDGVDLARYRSETLGRMLGMLSHLGLLRAPVTDEHDRSTSTGGDSP
jgi:3-hydroxyacyl-CoA dehydrogenase